MGKKRKWQWILILAVICLTVYNILPTIFYYSQSLQDPITKEEASQIAVDLQKRINQLETDAEEWLESFCSLIQVKPLSILPNPDHPEWISVHFSKKEEAARFRSALPRAGSLISFAPAQLFLPLQKSFDREVLVQRRIPIHIQNPSDFFSYVEKESSDERDLLLDRMTQIGLTLGATSDSAQALLAVLQGQTAPLEPLALQIRSIGDLLAKDREVGSRFAAQLTQGPIADRTAAVKKLLHAFEQARDGLKGEKIKNPGELAPIEEKEALFARAENLLKKWEAQFAGAQDPWNAAQIRWMLESSNTLPIGKRNPIFSEITLDPSKNRITLTLHPKTSSFQQPLIDEIAKISRNCNETVTSEGDHFSIALNQLEESSGFLVFNLEKVAASYIDQLRTLIQNEWHPRHPDLKNIPIYDLATYEALPIEQKSLALVFCNPLVHRAPLLKSQSIYCLMQGVERLSNTYTAFPESDIAQTFATDLRALADLFRQNGFVSYPSVYLPGALPIPADLVFEKPDFLAPLLAATREDFILRGTQKYAVLEFSNREHRLLTENKIANKIHEDLIKWKEEYLSASVSLNPQVHFDVPKPTRNIFWSNLTLSLRKLFKGDERKIIRWGLDLSGGKTVQIELRTPNGELVQSDIDLKQGINELYNRVNKMGVSEVSIRQVGNNIVLDFPGSQALSASDLIKSSTMYFHVINEKFSVHNPLYGETVNRFLQEVWNEAVVLGRKDSQSIAEIAYKHLHGPSDSARLLLENGLKLPDPQEMHVSSAFDDTVSKIALLRGTSPTEWNGQTHPLLLVFRNFALEGAQLENIHSSYDPSKGNYLSFEVQKGAGRDSLRTWTSRFSKEKVLGTPLETHSKGRGWRMAVVLNDSVISSPTLDSPLDSSAMISGSFSQREVQKLASDLKAGSLTFTPRILSEKNVSPELGQTDRVKGIFATFAALCLVITSMVLYYRFAGLISSLAVLLNLLILWAVLQNLGAALTLAGLAGVILTVAMAVDANVLVFERVKEEFALSGHIGSALRAGYKKAYSAIIDSNVTTIIAALILLHFDAGPIKSFAVNLIIGIVSSLFTALFMTRFYFTGWAQNPKNTALKMSNWIRSTHFDFLKRAKLAFASAFLIIFAGGALLFANSSTMFGMDFTGGFALNLELPASGHEAAAIEKALAAQGLHGSDYQVRTLNPSNHLRLLLAANMEETNHPFHGMPLETTGTSGAFPYEKNPRIAWVVSALQQANIVLASDSLANLHTEWTSMSGQMSDTMRNNALLGLGLALLAIFVYLAFRFESKFSAAALLCVLHDVLITLGAIGILHAFGVPVQIDLNTVAALMTIVGYSLNDTIIIFDRIREEMHLHPNKKLSLLVNAALNATLSRTTITSGTTLLVLLSLLAFGGASIFSFALVMTLGVFFGTLSSWFIASPLMLRFHKKETPEMHKI